MGGRNSAFNVPHQRLMARIEVPLGIIARQVISLVLQAYMICYA